MLGVITLDDHSLNNLLLFLLVVLGVGFLTYYSHTQTRIAEDSIKIYNLENQLRDWQRIAYENGTKYQQYKELMENKK